MPALPLVLLAPSLLCPLCLLCPQVVAKLFHIVEPDRAFFGRKDYQQWRVIERMVRDLDMAVQVGGQHCMYA